MNIRKQVEQMKTQQWESYGNRLVALLVLLLSLLPAKYANGAMTIDKMLDVTPFTKNDWETIRKGGTANTTIASASTREIAVGVACLLNDNQLDPLATIREVKPMMPDQAINAFGVLPENADRTVFHPLTLGDDQKQEANDYREFSGGFELNLSLPEIELFHSIDTTGKDDLSHFYELLGQQLFGRLSAYQESGLAGMQPYNRGDRDAGLPADELKRTLATAAPLKTFFPELYQIWKNYPAVEIKNGRENFLWANIDLNDRPAIILSHRIDLDLDDRQIIAERYFYASRFFNTGYALSAVVPVTEGRLFFYIYRVWVNQWRGLARLKQSAGQKLMIRQMENHLNELAICPP